MAYEKTLDVDNAQWKSIQLSKGSYFIQNIDDTTIVEYSINPDGSNATTIDNDSNQFYFPTNTTLYFKCVNGNKSTVYINDYSTIGVAPLANVSSKKIEVNKDWKQVQFPKGSYFLKQENFNQQLLISLYPDGRTYKVIDRGGEQVSLLSTTNMYMKINTDKDITGSVYCNTINVIASTGEGGGGGGTGPGIEYTFNNPLSAIGTDVSLNYKEDLTLKDNSLTLNLKVNEDFRALETVVETLKRPASDTNKGLVQIGDENQLAITMDGVLTFNTNEDGYLKSTFADKQTVATLKQQVETNKSDIQTLKDSKADKTDLENYTAKSTFDELKTTKVDPVYDWMTTSKAKYDGYEKSITGNTTSIQSNTEAIQAINNKLSTIENPMEYIGQINKSSAEIDIDKNNILNAFVQEKLQSEPKAGFYVVSNDNVAYVYDGKEWDKLGSAGGVSVGIATTETAGIVKLKDEFGYLVADAAADGTVKVKGIDTLALKTDVTQEIETAKQALTLEINKKANTEDVYTKAQADEKFVTKESQATLTQQVETNKQNIQTNQTNITKVSNELGTIAELTTTDKSSAVNAINELKTSIDGKVSNETYQADKQQLTEQIQAVDAKAEKNKEDIGTINTTIQGIQNDKLDKTEANTTYVKITNDSTETVNNYVSFKNTQTAGANTLTINRNIEAQGDKKDLVLFKQSTGNMSVISAGWQFKSGDSPEVDLLVFTAEDNKLKLSVHGDVISFKNPTKLSNLVDGVDSKDAVTVNQLTLAYNDLNEKISSVAGGLNFIGQDTQHTASQLLDGPTGEAYFNAFVRANTTPPRDKQKGDIVTSKDNINIIWNGTKLVKFGGGGEISFATTLKAGIIKAGTENGQLSVSSVDGLATVIGFTDVQSKAEAADTLSKQNQTNIGSMETTGIEGASLTDKINTIKTKLDGKLDSATYNEDKLTFATVNNVYTKGQADGKFASKEELAQTNTNIGTLTNLETTAKNNLVSAINEVKQSIPTTDNMVTINTDQTITGAKTFSKVLTYASAIDPVSENQLVRKGYLDAQLANKANTKDIYTKSQTDNKFATKASLTLTDNKIGTLGSLTTTAKNSLVLAINEVNAEIDEAKRSIESNAQSIAANTQGIVTINNNIGTIGELTTTAKDNLVNAINEVNAKASTPTGNFVTLDTTQTITAQKTFTSPLLINEKLRFTANSMSFTPSTNKSADILLYDASIGTNCYSNIDFANKGKIKNLPNPTESQDATNKQYVDMSLITKADITDVVNLITDQTVGGKKTFNKIISYGSALDPVSENDLVRKGYLDAQLANKADVTYAYSKGEADAKFATIASLTLTDNKIGTLDSLTTTAKDDLVAAINEVNAKPSGTPSNMVTIDTEQTITARKIFSARCYYKNSPTNENYGQFLIVDENTTNKRAFIAFASSTSESYKYLYGRFGIIGGDMIISVADKTKSFIVDVKSKYQSDIAIDEDTQFTHKKYVDTQLATKIIPVKALPKNTAPDTPDIPAGSFIGVVYV